MDGPGDRRILKDDCWGYGLLRCRRVLRDDCWRHGLLRYRRILRLGCLWDVGFADPGIRSTARSRG